jgi:hypothetical protein
MHRTSLHCFVILAAAVQLLCGCGESDELVRKKLGVILEDDLASLVGEMPRESIADSVYYVVTEYKTFPRSRYSALAVVEFFYLKGRPAKVVRKYRYHGSVGLWERYQNVYRFVQQESDEDTGRATR